MSTTTTTISYATPSIRKLTTRRAVLVAWLLPAAVQLVAWLILFTPYPGEGGLLYLRNWLASIAGFPLFTGIMLGVIRPDSGIVTFLVLAGVCWSILLAVATTSFARRLPFWVHLIVSCFWTFGGCLLWLALAAL